MANLTILIIITTAGVILLGYLVMCRLDHFIERGGILDSPQGRANQGVLIYGAPAVAEKLYKKGMRCRNLTTLVFPEDGFYSALFALSGDDQGNLEICRAAKRTDPSIYLVARCNLPELEEAFKSVGVNRVINAGETMDVLLAELGGVSK